MEFERISLAECAEFVVDNRGKTCPVAESGLPLIATNCLRSRSLYPTYETERYVSKETYASWFRAHPEPGDIIFVTKGSPGRVCLTPDPVDFCIAQDMVGIRAKKAVVHPLYLFAALRSPDTLRAIEDLHVGTMIPHFKKGDFDKLFLNLPSLHEQQEIGKLHFDLCERIHLLQKTNATLEAIAQALFKSWFVDFDPVHAKVEGREPEAMDAATAALFPNEFEVSELGLIPKGWRAGTLKDVCKVHDSKRVPLSGLEREKRRGSYPYYGAASVMDNIDDYIFDGVYVLLAEDGSVSTKDGFALTQYVWGRFWVNNHAHVLEGAGGFSSEQLLLLLQLVHIHPYITGAVQAKLSQRNMLTIPVVLPSDEISKMFDVLVSPLFATLRSNTETIDTLTQLRDTLLPRLISGKLRLPEAEAAIEDATA